MIICVIGEPKDEAPRSFSVVLGFLWFCRLDGSGYQSRHLP